MELDSLLAILPCDNNQPDISPPIVDDVLGGETGDIYNYFDNYNLNFTDYRNGTNFSDYLYSADDFDLKEFCKMNILNRKDPFKLVMHKLNVYFTPILILVGVSGNLLSFLVFTVTHLKRQSSSVYLACLAVVDTLFLLALFVVWLSWVKIPLFHRNVYCQLTVYLTYVTTFMSVYIVTAFTVERYIIVNHPFKKDMLCTTRKAMKLIFMISFVGCVLYSFALWTNGVVRLKHLQFCTALPHYFTVSTVLTAVDSVLTLIIPSVAIVGLNIAIAIKIIKLSKDRKALEATSQIVHYSSVRKQQQQQKQQQAGHIIDLKCDSGNFHSQISRHQNHASQQMTSPPHHQQQRGNSSSGNHSNSSSNKKLRFQSNSRGYNSQINNREADHKQQQQLTNVDNMNCQTNHTDHKKTKAISGNYSMRIAHSKVQAQYRTARMLLIVSSVFVVLNVPSHAFRLHSFIKFSATDMYAKELKTLYWHELFQFLYHLNFSINFFLYSLCGGNFRKGLKILVYRVSHMNVFRKLSSAFIGNNYRRRNNNELMLNYN